jgi:WD40 repeat protein
MIHAPVQRTQERRKILSFIVGQDITFIIQEYVGPDVPTKCLRTLTNFAIFNLASFKNGIIASDCNGDIVQVSNIDNSTETTAIDTIINKHPTEVYAITYLDNGNIVSSCKNGIHVWNIVTGMLLYSIEKNVQSSVHSLASLSHNQIALCEGWKSEVTILNIETCARVRKLYGHTDWATAIASLENGLVASGSWDNTIRVWNVETGTCVRTICEAHPNGINALTSLSGGLLASSSTGFDVKIWNVETGICEKILNDRADSLCSLGGGLLASGSNVGTVKIWG